MKWREEGQDYWLKLERGEEVMATLTRFLEEQGIFGGSLQGIGAIHDVELGFFDARSSQYLRRRFPEEAELIDFVGNVTRVDGRPFVHAHAVISGSDFVARGGHFFQGVVCVTMECRLSPTQPVDRIFEPTVGLKLMAL